jgi:hypothetical protein
MDCDPWRKMAHNGASPQILYQFIAIVPSLDKSF